MSVDARSAKNIATLDPQVQPIATKLIEEARGRGIDVRVISGHRSFEEQDALYAQGRSLPGPIVTKAKGGQSWHNYGLAWDIGIFEGKNYLGESPLYAEVGKIGETLGIEWGGSWKSFKDFPHFQYNPKGYTLMELKERKEEGKDLFA